MTGIDVRVARPETDTAPPWLATPQYAPVYSMRCAAKLAQVPARRLALYLAAARPGGVAAPVAPSSPALHAPADGDAASFVEVLWAYAVGRLIDRRLGWRSIAELERALGELLGVPWALVGVTFLADVAAIGGTLTRGTGRAARLPWLSSRRLAEVVAALEPLAAAVDVERAERHPIRWWPAGRDGGIVVDPHVAFGAPAIARSAVPSALARDAADVIGLAGAAGAFGVSVDGIRAAVRFERGES